MLTMLKNTALRLELTVAGPLPADVRRNMYIELLSALAYGAFYAATIAFIPVILRRTGATPALLALYTSQQFIGSVLTAFSLVLMRRRRTMNVIGLSWTLGRLLFIPFALIAQPIWMIALSSLFWLLEAFPAPGYARILQRIYPIEVRGKIMSLVRMGRVLAVVLVTPLAGWALDHWGYQALFPLGALLGVVSVYYFMRLEVNEGVLPARQTKALPELWSIVREDRRFAYYLFSFTVYGTGTLIAWTLYPLVQVDRLGLSYSQLGLLGFVQSLLWFLSYAWWGHVVDREGGVAVLRANCAVAIFLPLTYSVANSAWVLIPAFMIQGIISAGWDMGLINAGIQMAAPERVTEYAAIQATIVGLRGLIVPHIGVGLMALGVPMNAVFLLSSALMTLSFWMLGRIDVPKPGEPGFGRRQALRYRWPLRWRIPRM